jgi:GNAT superfamily N-acetyltransferase
MATPHTTPDDGDYAIVRASENDADALAQVIADAFHDLAVSRWLIGDPAERRAIYPGYFRMYVERALADGIVHTTADRAAAALWIPTAGPAAPPGGYTERLAAITGPDVGRFMSFDEALDAHHPVGVTHHHLAILAVHPDWQDIGIGTALLDTHHAILDQQGIPAYLEASDTGTRDLYQRHGYELRPDNPIRLPAGPDIWPMWRPRAPQRRSRCRSPAIPALSRRHVLSDITDSWRCMDRG